MDEDAREKALKRLDEQAALQGERQQAATEESTNAIRYKQVLLSAFLQQEEARSLLDRLIAEGRLSPAERPRLSAAASPPSDPPAEEIEASEVEAPEPEPDVQ